MDPIQRNGGTAGLITALALAILFILFMTSGLDPQSLADPAKALPMIAQKATLFGAIGVVGLIASGAGLVFTIGLFSRLRERTPTRAAALLAFVFIGLMAHGFGSVLVWQGGSVLAAAYAKDPTAAGHAWLAVGAVVHAVNALGTGFTGASVLTAGWAITDKGAMSAGLGWLAIVAGIFQIAQAFSVTPILLLIGFVTSIAWLAAAGSALRRAPTA